VTGILMPSLKLIAGLVASVSIVGCVSVNDVYLGDGSVGREISCDGRELSLDTCFEKAAQFCGANGFETVTREGKATARTYLKGSTDSNSGPFATRSILIRCNDDRPLPRYD